MKKNILIFCIVLTSISLTAVGYMNWRITEIKNAERSALSTDYLSTAYFDEIIPQKDVKLFYDIDSRFMMTVTKEDLNKATSILDIVQEDPNRSILSYHLVSITHIENNRQTDISESGDSPELTAAQIKLLHSFDYSTNFLIRAEFMEKNSVTGELEHRYATPHITVVPEKQAVSVSGKEVLIAYVIENTSEFASIIEEDKLQPGKINFTVTKDGVVEDVKLSLSSGHAEYDKKMLELVASMPGSWIPASNSKGEKVEQDFVFSFGRGGC